MEEAIQIIKLLWTQDGVTFKGKYHQVENAYCNPKPDQVPPVLIGGHGEKVLLKAVARHADWWNGFCLDVEKWSHKLGVLAGHCDDVGRDFDGILKSLGLGIALAGSDDEALRLAKSSKIPLDFLTVGSPETITAKLGEYVDAGVEYFQLSFSRLPNIEATQTFADRIIPELT